MPFWAIICEPPAVQRRARELCPPAGPEGQQVSQSGDRRRRAAHCDARPRPARPHAAGQRRRRRFPEPLSGNTNSLARRILGDGGQGFGVATFGRVSKRAARWPESPRRAQFERESLYRALSPRGNPRLSTLFAVTRAMGLTITVEAGRATSRWLVGGAYASAFSASTRK